MYITPKTLITPFVPVRARLAAEGSRRVVGEQMRRDICDVMEVVCSDEVRDELNMT